MADTSKRCLKSAIDVLTEIGSMFSYFMGQGLSVCLLFKR